MARAKYLGLETKTNNPIRTRTISLPSFSRHSRSRRARGAANRKRDTDLDDHNLFRYANECLSLGTLIGQRMQARGEPEVEFDAESRVRWLRLADAFRWLFDLRRRGSAAAVKSLH
jgi:hypothetical protein